MFYSKYCFRIFCQKTFLCNSLLPDCRLGKTAVELKTKHLISPLRVQIFFRLQMWAEYCSSQFFLFFAVRNFFAVHSFFLFFSSSFLQFVDYPPTDFLLNCFLSYFIVKRHTLGSIYECQQSLLRCLLFKSSKSNAIQHATTLAHKPEFQLLSLSN